MSTTQNNQSTETMKYTYYLGYNDVATTDRDIADFFEYCISRRANSKTEFKWNGENLESAIKSPSGIFIPAATLWFGKFA